MPRAGWCRECDRWVWVGEDGACQFGHDASSVDSVHEQAEPDPASGQTLDASAPIRETEFGVGELPENLRRFNWGAFFLPFFWGVTHRSWPVLTAWMIAFTTPVFIGALAGTEGGLTSLLGSTVISEIVSGLCLLWAGVNANALLWRRDATLREMVPSYRANYSVERFMAREKVWTIVGACLVALGAISIVPFQLYLLPVEQQIWREYGLTYIGAAMPLVWLIAEVSLAFWLDNRMRNEPPDAEQSARNFV